MGGMNETSDSNPAEGAAHMRDGGGRGGEGGEEWGQHNARPSQTVPTPGTCAEYKRSYVGMHAGHVSSRSLHPSIPGFLPLFHAAAPDFLE